MKLINKKIEEYDELIKDEKINVSKKNISKTNKINFGIGHNSVKEKELVTENKTRTKPLFKTIAVNLKRRTVIVDDILTTHKGMPIPSWIELSIIDVCNRSCSFCPKSDPKIAPDTYQKMQMNLINKLTDELKEINYKGSVVLCGLTVSFGSFVLSGFTLVFVESDNQGKENSIPFLMSFSTLLTSAILSCAVTFDEVRKGICFSFFFCSSYHNTLAYQLPLRGLSVAITDSFS